MKKFFTTVIAIVIIAIVGYGISFAVRPNTSIELESITEEASVISNGAYVMRDETVYYSTTNGVVYNLITEGDRVANNTVLSSVYEPNTDVNLLRQLQTVDRRLNNLEQNTTQSSVYASDSTSNENEIAEKMNSVIELAKTNNIEQIHTYREDINNIRSSISVSANDKITAVKTEKENIESQITTTKSDISSTRSGIFSSYTDGLESMLLPENMNMYEPSYIHTLSEQTANTSSDRLVENGNPVCKVMNNHNWYIIGILQADKLPLFKDKTKITVRFPNLSGEEVSGTISFVSAADDNNEFTFVVQISTYLESAFSYRRIDVQLVFEEYSGYKVPTEAIHTGDTMNDFYVYASIGSDTYKCECNVVYTNASEGYSIIQSIEEPTANRLSSMERVFIGER